MVGYGPEDSHFVVELTYNYPVKSYEIGDDFLGITIRGQEVLERAKELDWPILAGNVLEAPGGYQFHILDEPQPADKGKLRNFSGGSRCLIARLPDPVVKVTLASSNLERSVNYWNKLLNLQIFDTGDKTAVLGFDKNQTLLELKDIGT